MDTTRSLLPLGQNDREWLATQLPTSLSRFFGEWLRIPVIGSVTLAGLMAILILVNRRVEKVDDWVFVLWVTVAFLFLFAAALLQRPWNRYQAGRSLRNAPSKVRMMGSIARIESGTADQPGFYWFQGFPDEAFPLPEPGKFLEGELVVLEFFWYKSLFLKLKEERLGEG